jgi:hypothetical protein
MIRMLWSDDLEIREYSYALILPVPSALNNRFDGISIVLLNVMICRGPLATHYQGQVNSFSHISISH